MIHEAVYEVYMKSLVTITTQLFLYLGCSLLLEIVLVLRFSLFAYSVNQAWYQILMLAVFHSFMPPSAPGFVSLLALSDYQKCLPLFPYVTLCNIQEWSSLLFCGTVLIKVQFFFNNSNQRSSPLLCHIIWLVIWSWVLSFYYFLCGILESLEKVFLLIHTVSFTIMVEYCWKKKTIQVFGSFSIIFWSCLLAEQW